MPLGHELSPGAEADLAKQTSAYWYTFAKTGDPNHQLFASTKWPKYTAAGDQVLRIQETSEGGTQVQTGLRKAACDWQDSKMPPGL